MTFALLDAVGELQLIFILDVGGEGRYYAAWNLNPSSLRTLGPQRGSPIPRLILGRAERIPLPDISVRMIISERTPLRMDALLEIKRVISTEGTIILRHALPPGYDPHREAYGLFHGHVRQRKIIISRACLQETVFHVGWRRSNRGRRLFGED